MSEDPSKKAYEFINHKGSLSEFVSGPITISLSIYLVFKVDLKVGNVHDLRNGFRKARAQ